MTHPVFKPVVAIVAAVLVSGCTMKKQEAPPLAGPSEFGLSLTLTVSPDILTQDGASQSTITIRAVDANGQPVRNLSLRSEILVDFQPMDFGSLSSRNVATDNSGRATLVYTAPPDDGTGVDNFTVVTIAATPLGTDFMNSSSRFVSIRLVPPGGVRPPDGLQPRFTFAPENPLENQQVVFDASTSQSPSNNPIQRFEWSFGDGGRGQGTTVGHTFTSSGTFVVTLTAVDFFGRSASTSQSVTVGAGVGPSASFVFSPTEPAPGQLVSFNANASTAAPGRRITAFQWDFGDGTPQGAGAQVSHTFATAATYVVTLTVTDDTGKTATVSQSVIVKLPSSSFTSGGGGS